MGRAKVRIPKKMPAWLEVMFVYIAERDGVSKRTYRPVFNLAVKRWDDLVRDRSEPPAPRAPKKKEEAPNDNDAAADGDSTTETDNNSESMEEGTDIGESPELKTDPTAAPPIDHEEQARLDQVVREQIKCMPEPLRRSVRDAYGPPRTPTSGQTHAPHATGGYGDRKNPAAMGPGWRHAQKQADDLYIAFRHQAASVGVGEGHPLVEPVSCLYSLAREAIEARQEAAVADY